MLPLKRPDEYIGNSCLYRKILCNIPVIRQWYKFVSKKKWDRRIVASLHAQIDARSLSDVDKSWINNNDLGRAALVLFDSLKQRLGWKTEKIAANDPMSLLLLSEEDFNVVEIQMDLEDWLGKGLDPGFFNGDFLKFSLQEAVVWLAKNKVEEKGTSEGNRNVRE